MAFPLLLQVGAVPFVTSDNGILARRSNTRSNQPRAPTSGMSQSQTSSVILSRQQRAVIGQLMSEAAEAINDIIRQPATTPQTASICVNTDLSVPPNTPILTGSTSFEFPEPSESSNIETGNNTITQSLASSTSSEDESETDLTSSPSRPIRKRRRPPSFKKQHRVAPKKNISEADDEATSAEDNDSDLDNLELKLKLGLLCESREPGNSSPDESEGEKDDSVEKWSKIGEELRIIADRFGFPPETEDNAGSALANPFQVTDLLSLINLMLPVSVPHSLWSALFSYAAWKIFKKFQ